jgi:hypothetical protein
MLTRRFDLLKNFERVLQIENVRPLVRQAAGISLRCGCIKHAAKQKMLWQRDSVKTSRICYRVPFEKKFG